MLLLIILALIINCNKITNLENKYKFELTETQQDEIRSGNIEYLKNFIEYYGNKKRERTWEGEVPISYIIKYFNFTDVLKHDEAEKIILNHIEPYIEDGDCMEGDKNGNTPLHYCLEKEYFNIAKALLEKNRKFDMQALKNQERDNPLYLAIEQKKNKFINLFLDHMDNINTRFKYSLTPLVFTALLGKDEIVQILLEKNAVIASNYEMIMIIGSNLGKELKQKIVEKYINSLENEEFESALRLFDSTEEIDFNRALDEINKEINPRDPFIHFAKSGLERKKEEVSEIFKKYQIKFREEKFQKEAYLKQERKIIINSKMKEKKRSILSKIFKKFK